MLFVCSCMKSPGPNDIKRDQVRNFRIRGYNLDSLPQTREQIVDSFVFYLSQSELLNCKEMNFKRLNLTVSGWIQIASERRIGWDCNENTEFGHNVGFNLRLYHCPKLSSYIFRLIDKQINCDPNDGPCVSCPRVKLNGK